MEWSGEEWSGVDVELEWSGVDGSGSGSGSGSGGGSGSGSGSGSGGGGFCGSWSGSEWAWDRMEEWSGVERGGSAGAN